MLDGLRAERLYDPTTLNLLPKGHRAVRQKRHGNLTNLKQFKAQSNPKPVEVPSVEIPANSEAISDTPSTKPHPTDRCGTHTQRFGVAIPNGLEEGTPNGLEKATPNELEKATPNRLGEPTPNGLETKRPLEQNKLTPQKNWTGAGGTVGDDVFVVDSGVDSGAEPGFGVDRINSDFGISTGTTTDENSADRAKADQDSDRSESDFAALVSDLERAGWEPCEPCGNCQSCDVPLEVWAVCKGNYQHG